MAYATKYYFEYTDLGLIDTWRDELQLDGYASAEIAIAGAPYDTERIALPSGGDAHDKKRQIIRGTDVEIKILVQKADLHKYDEIATADYKDWKLVRKKNSTIIFEGYVKPEHFEHGVIENDDYFISLVATCGLGDLKGVPFTDADGNNYSDTVSGLTILKRCLTAGSLPQLDFRVQLNTYEDALMAVDECVLDKVTYDCRRFYENKDGRVVPWKCHEVIEGILKFYHISLFQTDGYWWVVNPRELNSYYYEFDYATLTEISGGRVASNLVLDTTTYKYYSKGRKTWSRPLRKLEVKFENKNLGDDESDNGDFQTGDTTGWNNDNWDTWTIDSNGGDYFLVTVQNTLTSTARSIHANSFAIATYEAGDKIKVTWNVRLESIIFSGSPPPGQGYPMVYCGVQLGSGPIDTSVSRTILVADGWMHFEDSFQIYATGNYTVYFYVEPQEAITFMRYYWNDISFNQQRQADEITFDRVYSFTNANPAFDEHEEVVKFGDSLQTSDIGALKVGGTLTSSWSRYGQVDNLPILTIFGGEQTIGDFQAFQSVFEVEIEDPSDVIRPWHVIELDIDGYVGTFKCEIIDYVKLQKERRVELILREIPTSDPTYAALEEILTTVDGEKSGSSSISINIPSFWSQGASGIYTVNNVAIGKLPTGSYQLEVADTVGVVGDGDTGIAAVAADTFDAFADLYSGADYWRIFHDGADNDLVFAYNGVEKASLSNAGALTLATALYTFSQGVTESAGAVKLGGTISENRQIDMTAGSFKIISTAGTRYEQNTTAWSAGFSIAGGELHIFAAQATLTRMYSQDITTGDWVNITMTQTSGIIVYDDTLDIGMRYQLNHYTTGSAYDRWIPDWLAVYSHLGGQDVSTTLMSPASGQDGYSIVWDETTQKYTLALVSGSGGGGVTNWLDLSDVDPTTYTGYAGYFVNVNATPNGLQFYDLFGYVDSKIAGQDVNANVSSPAAGQDGYAITWDNAAGEYVLADLGAGAGSFWPLTGSASLTGNTTINTATYYAFIGTTDGYLDIDTTTTDQVYVELWGSDSAGINNSSLLFDVAVNTFSWTTAGAGSIFYLRWGPSITYEEIRMTSSAMTVTDSLNSTGLLYAADYSANFTARSIPDWAATTTQIGGQSVNANITSPGAGQDGYSITWDNAAGEYVLSNVSGGAAGAWLLTGTSTLTGSVVIDGASTYALTFQNLASTGFEVIANDFYAHDSAYLTGLYINKVTEGYAAFFSLDASTGNEQVGLYIDATGASGLPAGNLILGSSATTNAPIDFFKFAANTGGAALDGFGLNIQFQATTSTTSYGTPMGGITAIWSAATHASRKGKVSFYAYDVAAKETFISYDAGTGVLTFEDATAGSVTLNDLLTLIGGQAASATLLSPGAGQDGYSITWNDTLGEYTLTDVTGGGGGTPASPDNSFQYNNGGVFGGSTIYFEETDGHIGVGVSSFSGWSASYKAIQGLGGSILMSETTGNGSMHVIQNAYFDGTNWRYYANGYTSLISLDSGAVYFKIGSSGTAGNIIAYTTAISINTSGNLVVWYDLDMAGEIYLNDSKYVYFGSVASTDFYLGFNGSNGVLNMRAESNLLFQDDGVTKFTFDLSGTGSGTLTCTDVTATSDERYKTNIQPLGPEWIDRVHDIGEKARSFNWRPIYKDDRRTQFGFVAQELEGLADEFIKEDDFGYFSINYPKLITPTMYAVAKLIDENKTLRKEINEIKRLLI